jgi:hypothetical protein
VTKGGLCCLAIGQPHSAENPCGVMLETLPGAVTLRLFELSYSRSGNRFSLEWIFRHVDPRLPLYAPIGRTS